VENYINIGLTDIWSRFLVEMQAKRRWSLVEFHNYNHLTTKRKRVIVSLVSLFKTDQVPNFIY